MGVKHLDDLGKVEQRAREAVDLVDHHDIYLRHPYVSQEALEGWAV